MADKEYAPREIIENRLLAILDDDTKVAVVVNREDLDLLIYCADAVLSDFPPAMMVSQLKSIHSGMTELRNAAFGDSV